MPSVHGPGASFPDYSKFIGGFSQGTNKGNRLSRWQVMKHDLKLTSNRIKEFWNASKENRIWLDHKGIVKKLNKDVLALNKQVFKLKKEKQGMTREEKVTTLDYLREVEKTCKRFRERGLDVQGLTDLQGAVTSLKIGIENAKVRTSDTVEQLQYGIQKFILKNVDFKGLDHDKKKLLENFLENGFSKVDNIEKTSNYIVELFEEYLLSGGEELIRTGKAQLIQGEININDEELASFYGQAYEDLQAIIKLQKELEAAPEKSEVSEIGKIAVTSDELPDSKKPDSKTQVASSHLAAMMIETSEDESVEELGEAIEATAVQDKMEQVEIPILDEKEKRIRFLEHKIKNINIDLDRTMKDLLDHLRTTVDAIEKTSRGEPIAEEKADKRGGKIEESEQVPVWEMPPIKPDWFDLETGSKLDNTLSNDSSFIKTNPSVEQGISSPSHKQSSGLSASPTGEQKVGEQYSLTKLLGLQALESTDLVKKSGEITGYFFALVDEIEKQGLGYWDEQTQDLMINEEHDALGDVYEILARELNQMGKLQAQLTKWQKQLKTLRKHQGEQTNSEAPKSPENP